LSFVTVNMDQKEKIFHATTHATTAKSTEAYPFTSLRKTQSIEYKAAEMASYQTRQNLAHILTHIHIGIKTVGIKTSVYWRITIIYKN